MTAARPRALSLELLVAIGVPVVTVVGGVVMLVLAFGHGFTPVAPPDPVKLHGS